MSNTLTNLIPDVYAALDVVSRELVGFIPTCQRDVTADRVALNQNLRVFQTNKNTNGRNIVPAMAFPATADQTIGNKTLTITKQRAYPFNWTGEEQMGVDKGPGYLTIQQDQIAQALRGLVNEIENDLSVTANQNASRAFGTPGTQLFTSNLTALATAKKILDDNGAPQSDRHLVMGTAAGAGLRGLGTMIANPQLPGQDGLMKQGTLSSLPVYGFDLRESAQAQQFVAGTGAAYTTNTAGYAVGSTQITLITGSGTINPGDIVKFASDPNNFYVVAPGGGISAPGTITINAPGLLVAIPASAQAVTLDASYLANVFYSRNALLLGARLPAIPKEGDLAIDRETVTDPLSGISFEVAAYPGYRMIVYEIALCWGTLAIKPEHMGVLVQ